jgi:hypothetical protein
VRKDSLCNLEVLIFELDVTYVLLVHVGGHPWGLGGQDLQEIVPYPRGGVQDTFMDKYQKPYYIRDLRYDRD